MELNNIYTNTNTNTNTVTKMVPNPWLAQYSVKILIDQNIIDNITKLSNFELTKNFGQLYVITLTDDCDYGDIINNVNLTLEDYLKIKNKLVIKQVSFSLLHNEIIKNLLTLVNIDDLPEYYIDINGRKQQFEDKILALSMLQISSNGINCFLKQYNGISSITDVIQMLLVNSYLQKHQFSEQNKLIRRQLINNMNESNYWALNYNCKLNITLKFLTRGFNLALTHRLDNEEIKNIINKIASKAEEDNDYLSFIFKKQAYVDASTTINKQGYQIYKINKMDANEIITKEEFNNILDMCINKKELYMLLTNILASKEYCHLVVNNDYALEKLFNKELFNEDKNDHEKRSLMQKYTPLFSYLWSYAWLTLYMEESIKRTRILTNDRFVFTLESASKLPYFPTIVNNPQGSPYLPILVAKEALSPNDNNLGVSNYYVNDKLSHGIVDDKEFDRRIRIFTTGHDNKNYFDGMNWSNIAMSGSVMAACLPKLNPLMLNFVDHDEINFTNYFDEYYKEADIDIMCNCSAFDYIRKVYEFANVIEKNIKKYNEIPEDQLFVTKVKPIKTVAIIADQEFVQRYILPNTNLTYVDIVLRNHDLEIKELFYPWYIKQKMEDNMKYINTPEFVDDTFASYFDICKPEDLLIVIVKSTKESDSNSDPKIKPNKSSNLKNNSVLIDLIEEEGNIAEEDVNYDDHKEDENLVDVNIRRDCELSINENLKFRISSNYLKHDFEMFKIKYDDFFSTVARFHLPIVRAYYDGVKTYLLPSCISACMTMMNIDYKYFAGSKDPIEIINKYRMRGYGTYLNSKEKIRMVEYSTLVEKWKKLYNINIKNNISVSSFFGQLNINSNLFKPSQNLHDKHTFYNTEYAYNLITESSLCQTYSSMFNGNFSSIDSIQKSIFNTTCISDNGYVVPLRKWLIEACYDQPIKIDT